MQRRTKRNHTFDSRPAFSGAPLDVPTMKSDYTLLCISFAAIIGLLVVGLTVGIIVIIIISFTCSPSVRCAQLECGSINVCGSNVSCGTCDTEGWTCVDHACNCTYPTLCNVSYECGTFTNNCGDVLTCGTCPQGVPCVDNLCIMNPWIVPLTDLFWVDSSADRVFPSGSFTTAMLSLKNANQSIADNITRESGATTTGYVASYDFGGTLQWAATLTNNASVGFAVSLIQVVDADSLLVGFNTVGHATFKFYDASNRSVPTQVHSNENFTSTLIFEIRILSTNGSWSDRFMFIDGNWALIRLGSITGESNYDAFFFYGQTIVAGNASFHSINGTEDLTLVSALPYVVFVAKGNIVIGNWEWRAKITGLSDVIYPRVFQSSEIDGSVIIGIYATDQLLIYDATDSYIGNVTLDVGDVTILVLVKYGANGTVEWFTKIGNVLGSGYGSGVDDGIQAYFSETSITTNPLNIYDAGNPPTLSISIPEEATYLQYLIKFNLSNGIYQWHAIADNNPPFVIPFTMITLPEDKILYPLHVRSAPLCDFYNVNGSIGVTIPGNQSESIVAYDSDGTVTWPGYSIRRAIGTVRALSSTGDNIFFDVRDLVSNQIPTWSVFDGLTTTTYNLTDTPIVVDLDGSLVALRLTF